MSETVDSGAIKMKPLKKEQQDNDYEIISAVEEQEVDPSKTGPKPKKLVAVETYGYEVGRGLTKRVVTPEDVFKLAALGCSDKEIATWFDVKEDTLRYNFAAIMAKGRQEMKTALRRAMFNNALNGNAALQIFLAKNMLGMSDTPNNSENNQPLPWSDDD
jgi:DNA-binding NarL/FixJ family response regulator